MSQRETPEPQSAVALSKSQVDAVGRRQLINALVGAATAGVALSALTGCPPGAQGGDSNEQLGTAEEAIKRQQFRWVNRYDISGTGDSLQDFTGALDVHGKGAPVAVALGRTMIADGGQGVFIWDPASYERPNGGTIIAGSSGVGGGGGGGGGDAGVAGVACDGGTGSTVAGRWKRIYSGAINVRWFGALGDGKTDATDAIQAAITAVFARGGGDVFVPAGDYLIMKSLLIPKTFGEQVAPFGLIGEGQAISFTPCDARRNGSTLHLAASAMSAPLLTYAADMIDTYFHRYENLSFISDSTSGAPLFIYPPGGIGANGYARFRACVIRNCYFFSQTGDTPFALIDISGAWNSIIDNVMVDGGGGGTGMIGLRSQNGSRLEITNFQSYEKGGGPNTGIQLIGGDTHTIRNARFEGLVGGPLIQLTGGTFNVRIDGLSSEGYGEPIQIDVDDAAVVSMTNVNVGAADLSNTYVGLRVSGTSSNVQVTGGSLPSILVEAGARHVHMEGIQVDTQTAVTLQPDSGSSISKDIVIKTIQSTAHPSQTYVATQGLFDSVGTNANVLHFTFTYDLSGQNLFVVAAPAIWGIDAGAEGQIITLLFTASTLLYGGVPGLPPQGVPACPLSIQSDPTPPTASFYTPSSYTSAAQLGAGSTMQLVFYGAVWYELSRRVNT